MEWLYRRDAFARGEFSPAGAAIRPATLGKVPVAAVIDRTSRLVPTTSSLDQWPVLRFSSMCQKSA